MGVVRAMFPNVTVPEPVAFHFPRWHSDPLFRGSYSNWPASLFSEHHQNIQATVSQRLWFAGEHTSQKYFGDSHSNIHFPDVSLTLASAQASCMAHISPGWRSEPPWPSAFRAGAVLITSTSSRSRMQGRISCLDELLR